MKNPGDKELAESAGNGNACAFEQLVDRHYMLVYSAAYRLCGVKEDAEDVTQEVFIKLARTIGNFKGEASFTTWLYRITVNAARDFHRKAASKTKMETAYLNDRRGESPCDRDFANPISATRLYSAIDKLPPKLKEAVILVLAEGLSHKEAAGALNCAEATVSWRVFQARRKLRKLLEHESS